MDETFAEARELLAGLISGHVDRDEVADWAMEKIKDANANHFSNATLWTLLDRLAGADLKQSPESYLHGVEDFEAWLIDADASM
ncbi:DNA-binding protein [Streptomyces sp. NBC_01579]|uniref:DNA-binding protein n=1 Tax=Streptomyces sp. NBC_01579 TaxID=2975885 RepID=UPI0038635463